MVESLIKNGSNVNVEDDDGSTPLDYAVWNGNQWNKRSRYDFLKS